MFITYLTFVLIGVLGFVLLRWIVYWLADRSYKQWRSETLQDSVDAWINYKPNE